MRLKDKINKLIEKIENERGYEFCGKTIKGITYYTFVDADYVLHYISAQDVLAMIKKGEE